MKYLIIVFMLVALVGCKPATDEDKLYEIMVELSTED